MIIKYKIKNLHSTKQCPHANFLLKVGSACCNDCEYNKLTRNDFDNGYVDCICPDDKKLGELSK